jgi:hypothetical protein
MRSGTYNKFLEAEFFLDKLTDEDQLNEEATGQYMPFFYYTSAFLSAFRSITLVMQKEFGAVAGFEEWYKIQQKVMDSDETLKRIVDERNINIHKKTVKPSAFIHIHQFGPEEDDYEIKEIHYSFKDTPRQSIIEQFSYAINKIEPIVDECESKFYKDDKHIGSLTIEVED